MIFACVRIEDSVDAERWCSTCIGWNDLRRMEECGGGSRLALKNVFDIAATLTGAREGIYLAELAKLPLGVWGVLKWPGYTRFWPVPSLMTRQVS